MTALCTARKCRKLGCCIGRPVSPNMQGGGANLTGLTPPLQLYTSECWHDVWCRKTTLSQKTWRHFRW